MSTVRYYGIEKWKKNYAAIRCMSTKLPSPFKMERYLGIQEFRSKYLLSCSDVEALTIPELLSYADFHTKVIQHYNFLIYLLNHVCYRYSSQSRDTI